MMVDNIRSVEKILGTAEYQMSAKQEKSRVFMRSLYVVKASGGKVPHAQAIGAIISTLDISEDERERLPYCNNGQTAARLLRA